MPLLKCKKRIREILQETIVFCKAVSAAMLCAASEDKGGGQTAAVVHIEQNSTADTIQAYRHSESSADSGGIHSSAQEQGRRYSDRLVFMSLQSCQPPTYHPPTPGFEGGL